MGDDAELYWEMEHNPYFWDEVEKELLKGNIYQDCARE